MRNPYRVIVWAPGAVGQACIKELLRLPEFDLVGVLAYNEKKDGLDVGELINQEPVGLKITTDKDAIVAMDADVVLWCGTGPFAPEIFEEMHHYVTLLLESGKSVITPVAFHYPPFHGPDYVKKLEDACKKGNSCVHGTGENPGFWMERVAVTLTGVCNDVEYMRLDEYIDLVLTGSDLLVAMGFGLPPDEARVLVESGPMGAIMEKYYYVETMNMVSMSLYGKPLEKLELDYKIFPAEKAFELSREKGDPVDLKVAEGHVAAFSYYFNGYVDGQPRLQMSLNWFCLEENSPFTGKPDSTWDIEIEGKPTSLKCSTQALASVKDNLIFHPGDPTSPTWYATAVPLLQAIPIACSHEPGIIYPSTFASCAPDLRLLEKRKTIIG